MAKSAAAIATTTVTAPVDRVWAVLADHEGMTGWVPGLKATLDKQGAGDRNGLGAVRRLRPAPLAPAIVEEVVAFEPGRRLAYKALAGVPLRNYGGDVLLAAVDGGTRITYTITSDDRVPLVEKGVRAVIAKALLTLLARAVRKAA